MRIRFSACLALRPSLLSLFSLVVVIAVGPARAVDLFAFHDARRVLAFAVPGTEPIPATQAALEWARRFYHLEDLAVVDVAFETTPTRFWRVTFLANGQTVPLYAVVLPDGRVVAPTVRDET